MFFFTDFWSIKRSWNIFWEKQGHQKTVRKSWQKSILSSLCIIWQMTCKRHISGWPWLEVMFVVALVLENVLRIRLLGSLVESSCDQGVWFQWWFFFYLLWGRMIQSLLCNKNVRWKPPRCEPLHLPLFLCSSIREEHFCRTSALCHRCAALLLWQWPHLQLVTWMIQRILGAPISATYALGYLGFYPFWSTWPPGWLYESQVVQDFFI